MLYMMKRKRKYLTLLADVGMRMRWRMNFGREVDSSAFEKTKKRKEK